jgi:hypothetical protein
VFPPKTNAGDVPLSLDGNWEVAAFPELRLQEIAPLSDAVWVPTVLTDRSVIRGEAIDGRLDEGIESPGSGTTQWQAGCGTVRLDRRDRDLAGHSAKRLGQLQRLHQSETMRAPRQVCRELVARPDERPAHTWVACRGSGVHDQDMILPNQESKQLDSTGRFDSRDPSGQSRAEAINGDPTELVVAVWAAETYDRGRRRA